MTNTPNLCPDSLNLTENGIEHKEEDNSSSSDLDSDIEDNDTNGIITTDSFQLGKAVTLYTTLWSKILSPKGINGLDLKEFSTLLPKLREFFLCTVCEKLVSSDFIISSMPTDKCPSLHLICEGCQGEEWKKPCKEHPVTSIFEANGTVKTYLNEIIESYKGFCSLFLQTRECRRMIELKTEVDPTFDALSLIHYLTEGALSATNININETSSSSNQKSPSKSKNSRSSTSPSAIKHEPQYFGFSESDSDEFEDNDSNLKSPSPIPDSIIEVNEEVFDEEPSSSKNIRTLQFIHPPCFTNWPDPNHVIQYASGNISMTHTPTYSIPVSISQAPLPSQSSICSNNSGIVGSIVRAVAGTEKKLKVRLPKKDVVTSDVGTNVTTKIPRKGCRCGNATPNPGKLTCCGQRCPCYVERKLCIDCRCKGCRNPHTVNGKKILPGSRSQVIEAKPITSNDIPNSNTVSFQSVQEVQQHPQTFTSIYPLNPVTSYTAFPIPVQMPISLMGISFP